MNKNQFVISCITVFSFLFSVTSSAATYEVSTFTNGPLEDMQGPVSTGTISSTSIDTNGSALDSQGDAAAKATADETGRSAVSTEGVFFTGQGFESGASAFFLTTFTNDTSSSLNFTYEFMINGPSVEIVDFASADQTNGPSAEATASIFMSTSGGDSDSVSLDALLFGGSFGHTFNSFGNTATLFSTNDGLGYRMDDYFGSFSGVLAAGETVTIDTELSVLIASSRTELGAKASIGDPNNLTAGPGISGSFAVSAVPIPGAVWLFASGLIGLISVARHRG